MAASHIEIKQPHDEGLKQEIHRRDVEQTEEEQSCRPEIVGEQSVPFHQRK